MTPLLSRHEFQPFALPSSLRFEVGALRRILLTEMTYFAYGSNLGVRRLRGRCPNAGRGRPAKLSGWRIVFNKVSMDGSSKANIEPSQSGAVWGAVFEIRGDEKEGLRGAEGHPRHYEEHSFIVSCGDEELEAVAYVACPDRVAASPVPPYGWYLEHVLRGAEETGLPADYIEFLSKIPTQKDSNLERDSMERAVWQSDPPSFDAQ